MKMSNKGLKNFFKCFKERRNRKEEEKKNDRKNNKDISRTFSGVVVGSVGSVHFWIVPWSGLYS